MVLSKILGLTGGIGCGKTTVSRMFANLGTPVIDADLIAHQLTMPGQPIIQTIQAEFGQQYLGQDGSLNRALMRELVFEDDAARHKLESILHPAILERIQAQLQYQTATYVILMVPLLIENPQFRALTDRILLVDTPDALQIERTMQRSGLTEAEVRAIMARQLTRQERQQHADDIIVNDAGWDKLHQHVEQLHQQYMQKWGREEEPVR